MWRFWSLVFLVGTCAVSQAENLLIQENGVSVVAFSSEYGGWEASNVVASKSRLDEPGVELEDFIWCTQDDAPFPHWVMIELTQPKWLTTLEFSNVLKEEGLYPGISAKKVEIWLGEKTQEDLKKVASFELERNMASQSVQIEPAQARWLKLVVLENYGHPTWTEMNALAVYDDGSRPASMIAELERNARVDIYGIYFDFGSAKLRPESSDALQQILAYHREYPEQSLVIEGHTDNIGQMVDNKRLSLDRANAVIKALVDIGADESRFSSEGYGSDHPVTENDTAQGRAKNRRVSVLVQRPATDETPVSTQENS